MHSFLLKRHYVAFNTIFTKEVIRFCRIWAQTLLPPIITMKLYFIIFGHLVGSRIGSMGELTYIQFIAPGLIMMSIITNSYANVSSSFFSAKFHRSVEELLVSPTPNYIILLGYVAGGVVRGLVIGIVVTLIAELYTHLNIHHYGIMFIVALLASILFSLAGFINALCANKYDDITIVPTFILTPLTYLGGVFYSIDLLPHFWKEVSLFNPILYMVNAFRYGAVGTSDVNVTTSLALILGLTIALFAIALHLLNKGVGIKT